MSMKALASLALIAGFTMLAGCKPAAQDPVADTATSASPAPAEPAAPATPATPQGVGLLTTEPAELTCDRPQAISVRWDVAAVEPAVELVEIWTGQPLSLFASGAVAGEAVTGPWALPGTIFVLRDKATGRDLDRIVVGGPACG